MQYRLDHGIRNRITLGAEAHALLYRHTATNIAHTTGLRRNLVYKLRSGGPELPVLRSTRDKVLNLRGARTPTTIGVQRRLQALAAIGYSTSRIAHVTGLDTDGLRGTRRRDDIQFIRHPFATKVVEFYDAHHMAPLDGTHDRTISWTKNEARRKGWAPPLAWDDIDRDKKPQGVEVAPDGDVDDHAVERRMHGDRTVKLNPAERYELLRRWHSTGRSLNKLETTTGINPWRVRRETREAA